MVELVKQGEHKGWICPDDPGEPIIGAPRGSVAEQDIPHLQKHARGRRVLEIGTGLGVSTRALCAVATWVYTVDIDDWVWRNIWPDLAAECDNLSFYTGLPRYGPHVEMAFIDGCHELEYVRLDFKEAVKRVLPGGVIVMHDWCKGAVKKACVGYEVKEIPTKYGLGVVQV